MSSTLLSICIHLHPRKWIAMSDNVMSVREALYKVMVERSSIQKAETYADMGMVCAVHLVSTASYAYSVFSGRVVGSNIRLNKLGRGVATIGAAIHGAMLAVSLNEVIKEGDYFLARELGSYLQGLRERYELLSHRATSASVDTVVSATGRLFIRHKDPFGC